MLENKMKNINDHIPFRMEISDNNSQQNLSGCHSLLDFDLKSPEIEIVRKCSACSPTEINNVLSL